MIKRELLSPAHDTASSAIVSVQAATTRVKELITECVSKGISDSELTKRLNAAIAQECKYLTNEGFREQFRKSLVTAARKWHYELSQTYRINEQNLRQAAMQQPLNIELRNLLNKTPYQKQFEFRKLLDDGTNPGIPVIKDYQSSVKLAMKALSAEPPKIVTTRNGRAYAMPARLRAEMAVRYAAAVENLQRLINDGVLFCWISSHPNCSPRCSKYQGKLYSLFSGEVVLDGKEYRESGTIDGIPYRPINEALAGPNGDGNGCISGYNCRHRAIEYERGSKAPADFSEAEIKREYAIDKRQRDYENRIRQMKQEEKQLRACGMQKEAAALRKKWRILTREYQMYSIDHDRAFYPYRCAIDRELDGDRFELDDYLDKAKTLGHKKQEKLLTGLKNSFIMEKEKVREPADFVLAKSVKEAEEYMARRASNVSYNGITNIRSLNQINRTFAYLSDKYQIKRLNEVNLRMKHKTAFAESHGDFLHIGAGFANNPKNKSVISSTTEWVHENAQTLEELKSKLSQGNHSRSELKNLKDDIEQCEKKLKFKRHNVIYEDKEIESVITHETGHIIAEQSFQQLSRSYLNGGKSEKIRNAFRRAQTEGDIYKISAYANKDVFEFFAECFTIFEMGEEKLPDYIEEMVKEVLK